MAERVMVAMSGGVDSTVAARLLLGDYEIAGGTMVFHDLPSAREAVDDAAEAARQMGIPHFVYDLRRVFSDKVMRFFAESYIAGLTPNPCAFCNRNVKFPEFIAAAGDAGFDKIATGHYAQISYDFGIKRWILKKGLDIFKDQSYFLYGLSQELLSRTLMPLGRLTKKEVKEIAAADSLRAAGRSESQDVCFLAPGQDYRQFIAEHFGYAPEPGDFISQDGAVLGRHEGALCYTIGQRRGLGVAAESRLYVLAKDMKAGTVTLGPEESLKTRRVEVSNINLIAAERVPEDFRCGVKLRYSRSEYPAWVHMTGECSAVVELLDPQRAPAPGQSAVFYDGDTVIGGGEIQ